MKLATTFLLLLAAALPVRAQNPVTVTGDTRTARAVLARHGSTPGSCQLDEIATPYDTHTFYVDTAASYQFEVTEPVDVGFGDDTIVLLYEHPFDPGSPCANFLFRYDNYEGGGATRTLDPAKQYVLVGSGLFADSEDTYTLRISGPAGANILFGSLPVELVSFDALTHGEEIVLRWHTASETNNAGFEVEQQRADAPWAAVAFVQGHGTTPDARAYEHRVPGQQPGTYRFRLKQVDYDGAFAYSAAVEVTLEETAFRVGGAHPDPFHVRTHVTVGVPTAQPVTATVHDALGRRVAVLFDGVMEGGRTHTLAFEPGTLPGGVYLVHVRGETFSATRTVTYLR